MTHKIEDILDSAMALHPNTRAYLAEVLLESLDFEEDFPIEEEWMNEIRRRCREIDEEKVELISGEKGLAQLHKKFL